MSLRLYAQSIGSGLQGVRSYHSRYPRWKWWMVSVWQ